MSDQSPETTTRIITIPTIGTILTLASPWVFSLYHEDRNRKFLVKLGIEPRGSSWGRDLERSEVVLPEKTKLVVDRIYVRKGSSDFDSITFRLKKGDYPENKKIFGRFWVKLGDVNRIRCEWEEETVKRDSKVSPLMQLAAEAE